MPPKLRKYHIDALSRRITRLGWYYICSATVQHHLFKINDELAKIKELLKEA